MSELNPALLEYLADALPVSDEALIMGLDKYTIALRFIQRLEDAGLDLTEYDVVIPEPQPLLKLVPRRRPRRRIRSDASLKPNRLQVPVRRIVPNTPTGDGMTHEDDAQYLEEAGREFDRYVGLGGTE